MKDLGNMTFVQQRVEVRTYWDQWVWIFVLFGHSVNGGPPEWLWVHVGGVWIYVFQSCCNFAVRDGAVISALQAWNETTPWSIWNETCFGVMNWRMYFCKCHCHQLRLSIIYLPAPLLAAYCLVYPWLHREPSIVEVKTRQFLLVNLSSMEGFGVNLGGWYRYIWIYHYHPRGGWPRPLSNMPPRGFLKIAW